MEITKRLPRHAYLRRIDVLVRDLWRWETDYKEASATTTNGWLGFRFDQRAAALEEARWHLNEAYQLLTDLPRLQ